MVGERAGVGRWREERGAWQTRGSRWGFYEGVGWGNEVEIVWGRGGGRPRNKGVGRGASVLSPENAKGGRRRGRGGEGGDGSRMSRGLLARQW